MYSTACWFPNEGSRFEVSARVVADHPGVISVSLRAIAPNGGGSDETSLAIHLTGRGQALRYADALQELLGLIDGLYPDPEVIPFEDPDAKILDSLPPFGDLEALALAPKCRCSES